MMLAIDSLLSAAEVEAVLETAMALSFDDGRKTAGRHARTVKANAQATASPARNAVLEKVQAALAANPVFQSAVRPRAMTQLIVSRYRQGDSYGTHVDDALMRGVRTDVSFTLFLNGPGDYDGGELAIEEPLETRHVKLAAGALILYPSTTLHRVMPVTRGERYAVVGWAESWVRDPGRREILFDMDRAVGAIFERDGKSELFDVLAKTRSNLMRLWAGN